MLTSAPSTLSPEVKPLIPAKKLAQIRYSSQPLSQGKPIRNLSIEEAEKMFDFTYTESLLGDRGELK